MKVIVIGGGPAGMMCAGVVGENNNKVILLDKNDKLGKKLYITGKGRANVTNLCDKEQFIANVVNNPKFIMSALSKFSSNDAMQFYERLGVPLKVERGGRVFPKSDKSSDIIRAHIKYLENNNVDIRLNSFVNSLVIDNNIIKGVRLNDNSVIVCDKVVIATGGMSYSSTGSTGDGYSLAKMTGHRVIDPAPALVSIELKEQVDLQGLSLKNVTAKIVNANGKVLFSEFGEMLFTDKGVSGPIILSLSSRINRMNADELYLSIDLKPALAEEQLDSRLIRDFEANANKDFVNSLDELLPKSLIPEVIYHSDIDPRIKVHQIDKKARGRLLRVFKGLKYSIKSLDNINNAIVTSGGVSVKDINPKTMESRIINGLYFVGEVIDIDALTGGYNIQIALSTGYLAGISI